ncbi:MAG: sulfatase [Bryobacterales bacterium]|nr:sulfatase [Bryobacterales bacterium]
MKRRSFLTAGASWLAGSRARAKAQGRAPNIVLILADDLGYGDLRCQGARLRTPNIDQIAREGIRSTHFYSASAVCSPARASLLTGRHAVRMDIPGVLFPNDSRGIPDSEVTIAQMLKGAGYRTACVGKWHVGDRVAFMPNAKGFDEFFGLPYSHDMFPLPLMRQDRIVADLPRTESLTPAFTEEAVRFIGSNREAPFFLYLAYTAPHIPLQPGAAFRGRSRQGAYGDSIEELDFHIGQVLTALREHQIEENTLVIFTSDNGPWYQGSKGSLRGRKGETWEGGLRVPFVARWPGRIPSGTVTQGMGSHLDLLPTLAAITGAPLPPVPLDGVSIAPMLLGEAGEVPHGLFLYFDNWELQCARMDRWKLHLSRFNYPAWLWLNSPRLNLPLPRPELYDLETDSEESYDASNDFPEIVAEIRSRVEMALAGLPDKVRHTYRDTMRRAVEDTPVGAYPSLRSP